MRTADVATSDAQYEDKLNRVGELTVECANLHSELDLCREEKRVLTESLDRSKDAIAAVIEQREKLAAKLREAKR